MKYRDLHIQTQREFPNNARTGGFGWLVRAGYLTRDGGLTPLGEVAMDHLAPINLPSPTEFLSSLAIHAIGTREESFFPLPTGTDEIIHCPTCEYTAQRTSALFQKSPLPGDEPLPTEKVFTPGCHTIDALAEYLGIPVTRTAKALMYTRMPSGKFVFVVIRGDMTLSETKLRQVVGDIRLATPEEIVSAGAVAGFASPVGLQNALIVVDDLIPPSTNLVAGANEADYHLLNTNSGRDYQPALIADLALAGSGDLCAMCGGPLEIQDCISLRNGNEWHFENLLLALAETHHDDKGLTFPRFASPFDAYLMHIPGKTMNTLEKAGEIEQACQLAGLRILFDDREERAGVKFNDADLIGCPIRVTIGERGLERGVAEFKLRRTGESLEVNFADIPHRLKNSSTS
jgi:prolyl-tRNA synthetase